MSLSQVIHIRASRLCSPIYNISPFARFQALEYDNRFFVNPGSATGAWSGNVKGCVGALLASYTSLTLLQ